MAHLSLTKAFLHAAASATMHCQAERWTYPPPPFPPFLLAQNGYSKRIAPTDNVWPKSDYAKRQKVGERSMGNPVVKTGLLNLYRPSKEIAVVKTVMTFLYRLSNSFAVVKTGLMTSAGLQLALRISKLVCLNSTGPQKDLLHLKTGLQNLCQA